MPNLFTAGYPVLKKKNKKALTRHLKKKLKWKEENETSARLFAYLYTYT